MTDARYVCPKCNMIEYCRKLNGMPRYPESTLRAFNKRHTTCDGTPEYRVGVGFTRVAGA